MPVADFMQAERQLTDPEYFVDYCGLGWPMQWRAQSWHIGASQHWTGLWTAKLLIRVIEAVSVSMSFVTYGSSCHARSQDGKKQ